MTPTSKITARKPPKGLSVESRKLWSQTLIEYDFQTAAELALLQQLCETIDRLRQIQGEIKRVGLLAVGYKGQPRASPLLAAEDSCRKTILALCRSLHLSASVE